MNRFTPDSLQDALVRVFAMALPQANIYTEIISPEVKPLVCAILLVALAFFKATPSRASVQSGSDKTVIITLMTSIMFVTWLFTSGNGRYFLLPLLIFGLVLGTLSRALTHNRRALAICVLALAFQVFTIALTAPQGAWAQATWTTTPAFDVRVDDSARTDPATYISYSEPSFSIAAIYFSPQSRWLNLAFANPDPDSFESRRISRIIGESERLILFLPVTPSRRGAYSAQKPPVQPHVKASLSDRGLFMEGDCRFLPAASLEPSYQLTYTDSAGLRVAMDPAGFWLCPLKKGPPMSISTPYAPTKTMSAIAKIENLCPRFFPRNGRSIQMVDGVTIARYAAADMLLRVYENGRVAYQYYNNFKETELGGLTDIISKEKMDCNQITGRQTLPWQRIQ